MEVIIKEAGNRLDKSLADLTELSRSQANEAIKAGTVLVNGKSAKAKYVVKRVMSSPMYCLKKRSWNTRLKIFLWILSTRMRMWQWSTNLKV